MTTTTTLAHLARAWLDGDASAGPALCDLLEQEGWRPAWRPWAPAFSIRHDYLSVGGFVVAEVFWLPLAATPWHWSLRGGARGRARTRPLVRRQAEAALWQALRGEGRS